MQNFIPGDGGVNRWCAVRITLGFEIQVSRADVNRWGAGCGVNHPTKPPHPTESLIPADFHQRGGVKRKPPHTPRETLQLRGGVRGGHLPPTGAGANHPATRRYRGQGSEGQIETGLPVSDQSRRGDLEGEGQIRNPTLRRDCRALKRRWPSISDDVDSAYYFTNTSEYQCSPMFHQILESVVPPFVPPTCRLAHKKEAYP